MDFFDDDFDLTTDDQAFLKEQLFTGNHINTMNDALKSNRGVKDESFNSYLGPSTSTFTLRGDFSGDSDRDDAETTTAGKKKRKGSEMSDPTTLKKIRQEKNRER